VIEDHRAANGSSIWASSMPLPQAVAERFDQVEIAGVDLRLG